MIKGRTKIELFENGVKVQENMDNNMVTNALSMIFGPSDMGECFNKDMINNEFNLPIKDKLLGGILLFDETLDEDINNVYPPKAVVGHAGSGYAEALPTRGSYNLTESGEIENGWRHVWDFGTDKANGNIACVCLTSKDGGCIGYGVPENPGEATSIKSALSATQGLTADNASWNYGAAVTLGDQYFVLHLSGNNIIKREWNAKVSGLSLSDLNNYTNTTYITSEISVNSVQFAEDGISLFSRVSNTRVRIKKYAWDSSLISDTTVTLGSPTSTTNPANVQYYIFDNHLFGMSNIESNAYRWKKFQLDGTYVGESENSTVSYLEMGHSFRDKNGQVFSIYRPMIAGGGYNFVANHKNNGFPGLGGGCIGERSWYCIPHYKDGNFCLSYLTRYASSSVFQNRISYHPWYLATINNLATPVTKTSAQTMKITYEITQGG